MPADSMNAPVISRELDATATLADIIAGETAREVTPAAAELTRMLVERYRHSAVAVLHYGSCLRRGTDEGLVDLYLLVDDYANHHRSTLARAANAMLPPNVYYLETRAEDRILRAKYAVMSLAQFERHASGATFNASIRARFAQPTALTWVRDEACGDRVRAALAAAVRHFLGETLGLMPPRFSPLSWWSTALSQSYGAELRPEQGEAAAATLIGADSDRYAASALDCANEFGASRETGPGSPTLISPLDERARAGCVRRWRLRRYQGKLVNLLRLLKALFTFRGGIDYALWKIERHSGIRVEPTPLLRRWPLIGMWGVAWRLYRKGAFR